MALSAEQAAEQADVISRLTAEEIPVKLRCSLCTNIAVNAFRLPCCGQSICENCQPNLPSTCPVCEHSPLSASDATPNKALRMTIRAFLKTKTAEKKAILSKEQNDKPLIPLGSGAVSTTAPTETATSQNTSLAEGPHNLPAAGAGSKLDAKQAENGRVSAEAQIDVPRQSVEDESVSNTDVIGNTPTAQGDSSGLVDVEMVTTSAEVGNFTEVTEHGVLEHQEKDNSGISGFDATNGASGPHQSWNNGDNFNNPVMQAMENGMPNGGWPDYSTMMGMPGMNMGIMDNMGMVSGMFGGFGGPGTGMDGMNMGMGMSFDASQSGYMGWNGQPGWNIAQDNFNPMTNGAHANGMGAYGANAGYPPIAGGYNHFNQMNHQQYPNNNFQGNHFHGPGNFQQGRGRGFGRGRGQYGAFNSTHAGFQNQFPSNHPQQQTNQLYGAQIQADSAQNEPTAVSAELENSAKVPETAKELSAEVSKLDELANDSKESAPFAQDENSMDPSNDINAGQETVFKVPETIPISNEAVNVPMLENGVIPPRGPAALVNADYAHDFAGRGRGNPRGGFAFRGRGSSAAWNGVAHPGVYADLPESPFNPLEPQGQGVLGAPKAPKALRDGRPNTGYRRGGFGATGRGGIAPTGPGSIAKPESPPAEQKQSQSQSHSRASSPRRESDKRHHRHRSSSISSSTTRERRQSHRQHESHSRRHNESESRAPPSPSPPRTRSRSRSRSRSQTPSHKRPSRRDKERDLPASSSTKHSHTSRRSHRDRERSPSRDRDRHRSRRHDSRSYREDREDRDRERERERERDRTRGRDDRSSRRHSRRESRTDQPQASSSSSTYPEKPSRSSTIPSGPRADAATAAATRPRHRGSLEKHPLPEKSNPAIEQNSHDREREERNRERLLKEQQRRDELQNRGARKRPREEDVEQEDSRRGSKSRYSNGGGSGGRRSYKYEDEESDEARALRVENEREAQRWG